MSPEEIGLTVAVLGGLLAVMFAFAARADDSALAPRGIGDLPDTRNALVIAVGLWLIARFVAGAIVSGVNLTGPVRMLVAVGSHVAVAAAILKAANSGTRAISVSLARRLAIGVLGGIATFGAVFAISAAVVEFYALLGTPQEDIPQQDVVEVLGNVGLSGRLAIIFSACVLAPFAEEVFYRGILFPALAQWMSERLALLVQALVFGFVHFWFDPTMWPLTLPIAAVGWGAGWIFARTGSLRAAIALHTTFNSIQVALYLIGDSG